MKAFALVVLAACSAPAVPPVAPHIDGSAVATAAVCTCVVFGADRSADRRSRRELHVFAVS